MKGTGYFHLMIGIAVAVCFLNFTVFAQEPPPMEPVSDPGQETSLDNIPRAPEPVTEEPQTTYNPQGARDPFRSLLEGMDKEVRPPGLAGIQISELTLQGIQIGLGRTAIVKGPENIAYGMEVGDTVFDGKLIEIYNNKVVFEKIIYDAFGREKEKQNIEIYLHRK